MIRINLLPTKAVVKVTPAKTQLIMSGVAILLSLIVLFLWAGKLSGDLKQLDTDIEKKQQELKEVKAALEKLENIKKVNEDLKKKLDVINTIEASRTGPVWVMDQLSDAITRFAIKDYNSGKVSFVYKDDKVFLTAMKIEKGQISMDGFAVNNTYLVAFLNNLRVKSDVFSNISLKSSETTTYQNALIRKFKLTCDVNMSGKPLSGGPTIEAANADTPSSAPTTNAPAPGSASAGGTTAPVTTGAEPATNVRNKVDDANKKKDAQ